ncbi:hypothetical protein CEXT_563101 [Caerostris extrusa]|uniref:Uncharacterized protein n=1 Tax=Caerostris extrusa TaxID=172846 RepID=A0AAV4WMS8_CAEEX|nr:hypothetical protein CEXT_563101 [Caerostris extrusa]
MSFSNPPTYLIVYRWQSKDPIPESIWHHSIPYRRNSSFAHNDSANYYQNYLDVIARLSGLGWFEYRIAPANRAPNISHIGSPDKYAGSTPTVLQIDLR